MFLVIWNLSQPGFTNRFFCTASIHGCRLSYAFPRPKRARAQMVIGRRPMPLYGGIDIHAIYNSSQVHQTLINVDQTSIRLQTQAKTLLTVV